MNYNNNWNNNMNNYQNYNTYNQFNNVESILQEIQNLIVAGDTNMISPSDILRGIDELVRMGKIDIVGKGTNRIAIEVKGDMSSYISFRGPCIIKVPYTVQKAIDDNNREKLLYSSLMSIYQQTNEPELKELLSILPAVCEVRGFPALVAQEKVIPIERSHYIKNPNSDSIATECINLLMGQFKTQCVKLCSLMDKYTFAADICPIVTPFQYGFKTTHRGQELTLLDTGYTLPKFMELNDIAVRMDNTGSRRKMVVIGRDIDIEFKPNGDYDLISKIPGINADKLTVLKPTLSKSGLYMIENPHSSKLNITDIFQEDMIYFNNLYITARNVARTNPGTGMWQYFQLVKFNKMSLYNK